jgi:hypothetical protein
MNTGLNVKCEAARLPEENPPVLGIGGKFK